MLVTMLGTSQKAAPNLMLRIQIKEKRKSSFVQQLKFKTPKKPTIQRDIHFPIGENDVVNVHKRRISSHAIVKRTIMRCLHKQMKPEQTVHEAFAHEQRAAPLLESFLKHSVDLELVVKHLIV